MAYTAAKAIVNTIRRLGSDAFSDRTLTGGSTTTIIDTSLEDMFFENDLKFGTVIPTYDASDPGEALATKHVWFWSKISAYDQATQTATIATLPLAVAAGDRVTIIMPEYPIETLINLLNETLLDLGPIVLYDSSLTSDSDILEYELPAAIDMKTPLAIYVARDDDTNMKDWMRVLNWRIEPDDPGDTRKLILSDFLDDGYSIMVIYEAIHPTIKDYSTIISSTVPQTLIELKFAAKIMDWFGVNDANMNRANKIQADLSTAEKHLQTWYPESTPDILDFRRRSSDDVGDIT